MCPWGCAQMTTTGRIEAAARTTIDALAAEDRDEVLVATLLALARKLDRASASAAPALAAQLRLTWRALTERHAGGGEDGWAELVAELQGSGTPLRDADRP